MPRCNQRFEVMRTLTKMHTYKRGDKRQILQYFKTAPQRYNCNQVYLNEKEKKKD